MTSTSRIVRRDKVDGDDPRWRAQLDDLESEVSGWVGNDVRVLEYADDEVATGVVTGERVLADIERDGVRLAGPIRYLSNLRRRSVEVVARHRPY